MSKLSVMSVFLAWSLHIVSGYQNITLFFVYACNYNVSNILKEGFENDVSFKITYGEFMVEIYSFSLISQWNVNHFSKKNVLA